MTIFKTAYDTSACNGHVMDKTVSAVEKAITLGWVAPIAPVLAQNLHPSYEEFIYLIQNDSGQIPSFGHPLLVKNPHALLTGNKTNDETGDKCLAVDVRGYGRWDELQRVYIIRNQIDYQLAMHRATLNQLWLRESPAILRDISKLPLSIYVSWLSETIARRFALEPDQQMKLAILTGIFYLSLFTDRTSGEAMEEREKLRVANSLSQALRIKAQDVITVLDKIDIVPNVNAYCQAAEEITGSVRLRELNIGILYSMVAGSWFTHQKELITVSLEHPPTWIAILMAACTERYFKNSAIAKLIERQGKDTGKNFLMPVLSLIKIKNV